MSTTSETMQFQAEVQQLLHLMINSIYSNKRNLFKGTSFQCFRRNGQRKFESLTNPDLLLMIQTCI